MTSATELNTKGISLRRGPCGSTRSLLSAAILLFIAGFTQLSATATNLIHVTTRRQPRARTWLHKPGRRFMKELVLALTVVALCSISFAGSPGPKKINLPQEADAAAAQETATQAATNSPFTTTNCSYYFTSGSNNTYLSYCVTVNGNILNIVTPLGQQMSGPGGEGYGVCNESPATEYHDYAADDTGNWNAPILLSQTASSVKIARTTSNGNWTLTQTITKVPATASIKIVMALKNNQAVSKVAYLVRYADVYPDGGIEPASVAQHNGAFAWNAFNWDYQQNTDGLQLQNVGTPQFGFWQGYAQVVENGPNACAFAYNAAYQGEEVPYLASLVMAYVGPVPAGGTKTVTLTYRGM
jgi:hypothetical protein